MKRIKFLCVIISLCLMFSFFACSSNIRRNDDFQIADKYFEKRKMVLYWDIEWHYRPIDYMENQKFLTAVKSDESDRYDEVQKFFDDEKYFSPQTSDNYGQTALMWACWNDDYDMVRFLLETVPKKSKTDKKKRLSPNHINKKSNNGYTALFCAAYCGNDSIMRLLLNNGAEIDVRKDDHGENLLHKMAKSRKANNMYSILVDEKYGINSKYKSKWQQMFYEQDKSGYTPFHYAIVKNDTNMVQIFLELEKKFDMKRTKDKKIVNLYAELGNNQRVYPLYTAYKRQNHAIFQLLLEDENLDINIKFPDGNQYHDYEHIDERFDLSKRKKYVFENQEKNTNIYESNKDDENIFSEMFDYRDKWENNNRNGELTVIPSKIGELQDAVIEIIEYGTEKRQIFKSSDEVIARLENLGKNLYDDSYFNMIGVNKGKNLLKLAVQNKKFKTKEKIDILEWLLDNGYCPPSDENILYYCLHGANDGNDWFAIGEQLIYDCNKYKNYYKFERPNQEAYFEIMINPSIRKKNAWDTIKNLLETIKADYPFNQEDIWTIISCAVLGEKEPSYGKRNKFPEYALELFNFFRDQYCYEIRVGEYPLCSWFYKIGFDTGVDEILKDAQLAKDLKLSEQNKYQFIKLLNNDKTEDEQRKKKIEEWKELYAKIFPKDSGKEKVSGTQSNSMVEFSD